MNVTFLETFYWLATLRSFSEAAKRLRVSQPVVSMRMAALQRLLGAQLYQGSGKSFELTNAGRRVLAKCEGIVVLAKELADEARDAATAATSGYVGVTDVVALTWLPEFLNRIKDVSGVNVGIKTGTLAEQMAALEAGTIDVALVLSPVNDPGLISDDICEYAVKWVGSPQLLSTEDANDIFDLTRLPIIRSPHNSYRHEKMLEYFQWHNVAGAEAFQPRWIDVGLGISTCAHLASRGLGVTALPVATVAHLVNSGQLVTYEIPQHFLPWQIGAVRKRGAQSTIVEPILECAHFAANEFSQTDGMRAYFRASFSA